jgi:sorbitol/mannitol transport system permease protein
MTLTQDTEVEETSEGAAVESRVNRSERWKRRGPLLPALIFAIAITQLPFLVTIALSLVNWSVLKPGDKNFFWLGDYNSFAGLGNYKSVFTDPDLRPAIINTVVMTVAVVILSVIIGLVLAILLDRRFPGRGLARTLLITPFLVMPAAAALVWKHAMYNPEYGLLNGLLHPIYSLFGADPPAIDFLGSAPMVSLIVSLVWQWTPFMMLILLAGLQSQPGDVLEAARLDRASGWQIFRFITLPHMRRYIELAVLLGTIYILQTFDGVIIMTNGGPGQKTTNLPYLIYDQGFVKSQYGLAAAAGVVVVIASIVIATYSLRLISSLLTEEGRR